MMEGKFTIPQMNSLDATVELFENLRLKNIYHWKIY